MYIEHSRTTARILGAVIVLLGFAGAVLIGTAVRAADEGIYTDAEATRFIAIGSAASILTLGGVGALLYTSRRSVCVDPQARMVSVDSATLGFHRRRALPLDEEGVVATAQREQSTGTTSVTFIAVDYVHPDGRLELTRSTDPQKARAFGERIAAACGRPLLDTSGGIVDVRRAGDLDRTAVSRGLAEGLEWPRPRVSSRVRWHGGSAGEVDIVIGPPGFGPSTVLGGVMVAAAVAMVVRLVPGVTEAEGVLPWIFAAIAVALAALFGAMGTLAVQRSLRHVERWRADRHGVGEAHAERWMSADDVEQVERSTEGHLVIRGDEGSLTLGQDLDEGEMDALRSLVLLGLAGRPAPPVYR